MAGLSEAAARQPLEPGGWSVHDVLAHRLFWERQEVEGLGQHLLARRVELLDFPSKRLDAANAAAVRTMQGMTAAEVLRDLARTRAALLDLVRRLPDDDLNPPGGDARTLLGVALTHDREHAAQIRAWRESGAAPAGPPPPGPPPPGPPPPGPR